VLVCEDFGQLAREELGVTDGVQPPDGGEEEA
jgi:hypothetical protein